MAKISTYTIVSDPSIDDKLIGTDISDEISNNETKNFLISSILRLLPNATLTLPTWENNNDAIDGGLSVGQLYKNYDGVVYIVY